MRYALIFLATVAAGAIPALWLLGPLLFLVALLVLAALCAGSTSWPLDRRTK